MSVKCNHLYINYQLTHISSLLFLLVKVASKCTFIDPFSSADQNNSFANSVGPNETAHDEPSHQDLHCLPYFRLLSATLS